MHAGCTVHPRGTVILRTCAFVFCKVPPTHPPTSLGRQHDKLEAELRLVATKALNHRRASDGATPLMLACELGDLESVR